MLTAIKLPVYCLHFLLDLNYVLLQVGTETHLCVCDHKIQPCSNLATPLILIKVSKDSSQRLNR